ncbi:Pr6Pr family membrane protein [Pseudomonas sp. NA-150]|uniref:Pr6Pr family membrane protein n=1 Tax=Pseudomonas sp. NA-150 TaxID=3367525 RepID=UPI0037CA1CC1
MHCPQAAQRQRMFTLLITLLSWSALAIQMYLVFYARWIDHTSVLGGLVRYFSFFTMLTNTLVATALTCALSGRDSRGHRLFRAPAIVSGITVSILLVGIAYSLLLRHLWRPDGLQWLADELLHDVVPVLFALYWWLYVPKGLLRLKHVLLWILYPVVYFAYILLRGNLIGDYLYYFIDAGTLGYPQALINASGVLAGFVVIGLVLLGLDWLKGRKAPTL